MNPTNQKYRRRWQWPLPSNCLGGTLIIFPICYRIIFLSFALSFCTLKAQILVKGEAGVSAFSGLWSPDSDEESMIIGETDLTIRPSDANPIVLSAASNGLEFINRPTKANSTLSYTLRRNAIDVSIKADSELRGTGAGGFSISLIIPRGGLLTG